MTTWISPTERHAAIVAAFLSRFEVPCSHVLELREERRGDLRCASCDVARMTPLRKDGKTIGFECWTETGESLGIISDYEDLRPSCPVTPDTTGTEVVEFCLFDEDERVTIYRYPVIAWRHELEDYAQPVTVTSLESTTIWCFELKTGLWVFPQDREFTSLDKATDYARTLLEELRRR